MILYVMWSFLEKYLYYLYLDDEVEKMEIEKESLWQLLQAEDYGEVTEDDLEVIYRPLKERYEQLSSSIQSSLFEWAGSINEEIKRIIHNIMWNQDDYGNHRISMLPEDFFGDSDIIINFNYSDTIECFYHKQCYHFHGCYNYLNPPVIGHHQTDFYCFADMMSLVLVADFYKNTNDIIKKYSCVYEKIKDADMIVVLGLGYHETDQLYFQKIYEICRKDVIWILYYYEDKEKEKAVSYISNIGVKAEYIKPIAIQQQTPYSHEIRYTP